MCQGEGAGRLVSGFAFNHEILNRPVQIVAGWSGPLTARVRLPMLGNIRHQSLRKSRCPTGRIMTLQLREFSTLKLVGLFVCVVL
jgi:hypothetical protein